MKIIKNVAKRMLALALSLAMVLTMMPALAPHVHAAALSEHGVPGLLATSSLNDEVNKCTSNKTSEITINVQANKKEGSCGGLGDLPAGNPVHDHFGLVLC